LVPGSRRRATDPASAPAAMVTDAEPHERAGRDGTSAPDPEPDPQPEPVGALAVGSAEPS
jgi:hypothetical protein